MGFVKAFTRKLSKNTQKRKKKKENGKKLVADKREENPNQQVRVRKSKASCKAGHA